MIVVPISTSDAQARRGPTAVALAPGAGGVPRASVALCHQVTTLDRTKLTERLGALPTATLTAIEEGLRAAFDLDA